MTKGLHKRIYIYAMSVEAGKKTRSSYFSDVWPFNVKCWEMMQEYGNSKTGTRCRMSGYMGMKIIVQKTNQYDSFCSYNYAIWENRNICRHEGLVYQPCDTIRRIK